MNLLSYNVDAKTVKSNKSLSEYITAIMYLSPADSVPGINLCITAKAAGCIHGCLHNAGRAQIFPAIHKARIRKTELFRDDQAEFMRQIEKDVRAFIRKAERMGKLPAIRLNGTSDVQWEKILCDNGKSLMENFPSVQWYDYTKIPSRKTPANYHLTVSYSEAHKAYADKVRKTEHNIAVVFRDKNLPVEFLGRRVINGDKTDLRFLDQTGVVVGLYAKGRAKKDYSGFVIDSNIIARG